MKYLWTHLLFPLFLLYSGTTSANDTLINRLQALSDSGIAVRYSEAALTNAPVITDDLSDDALLRWLGNEFSTVNSYREGKLASIDILPKGRTSVTDLITLPNRNMAQPSETQAKAEPRRQYTREEWATMTPEERRKVVMKQQRNDGMSEREKERAKEKQQRREKDITRLRKLREKDPEQYKKSRLRYPADLIRDVEQPDQSTQAQNAEQAK